MSLVTGTVTLSLAEVDSLRNQITDKETKITELTKELTEVRLDKRIMKLTEYVGLKEKDYMLKVDEYGIRNAITQQYQGWGISEPNLNRFITVFPNPIIKDKLIEFVNFDDVKIEVRNQLEKIYEDEIRELKSQARKLRDQSDMISSSNTRELKRIMDDHEKEVKSLTDKISEIETGKKEQTKIEELESQLKDAVLNCKQALIDLDTEINKKWYQKLFKTKA